MAIFQRFETPKFAGFWNKWVKTSRFRFGPSQVGPMSNIFAWRRDTLVSASRRASRIHALLNFLGYVVSSKVVQPWWTLMFEISGVWDVFSPKCSPAIPSSPGSMMPGINLNVSFPFADSPFLRNGPKSPHYPTLKSSSLSLTSNYPGDASTTSSPDSQKAANVSSIPFFR